MANLQIVRENSSNDSTVNLSSYLKNQLYEISGISNSYQFVKTYNRDGVSVVGDGTIGKRTLSIIGFSDPTQISSTLSGTTRVRNNINELYNFFNHDDGDYYVVFPDLRSPHFPFSVAGMRVKVYLESITNVTKISDGLEFKGVTPKINFVLVDGVLETNTLYTSGNQIVQAGTSLDRSISGFSKVKTYPKIAMTLSSSENIIHLRNAPSNDVMSLNLTGLSTSGSNVVIDSNLGTATISTTGNTIDIADRILDGTGFLAMYHGNNEIFYEGATSVVMRIDYRERYII